MLKRERLLTIQGLVDARGIISVNEICAELDVSTMTVRRDLEELAAQKLLTRVHGGAQSLAFERTHELTRLQKQSLNTVEKDAVARRAASLIEAGDAVYIGPGTTNELIAAYVKVPDVRIVTNSLPVFESFQRHADRFILEMVGGIYRSRSGAFIGSMATSALRHLSLSKAFTSANGIAGNALYDASPEEGEVQRLALNNAEQRYLCCDVSKLNHRDFYSFYDLDQMDALITNATISAQDQATYSRLTQIITV
ncbi:DeoR/GlpR family DNA-binding transcription regulator [Lacticaseibacillus suibinensis]|uniref:DeoR/GlpR family DNA-binding transcription regulator n=1 Tax=Lacticaseibacillus suibinensis TaxID=2486011 RepID=UPI000F76863D|nr:DeoR/GlpR family DNA-binding transcription regulator [Lacticaseibacillus suibinensis]